MKREELKEKLKLYKSGQLDEDAIIKDLINNSVMDLGFANLDIDRKKRHGFGEVIYGERKKLEEILEIFDRLLKEEEDILITRVSKDVYEKVREIEPKAVYYEDARCIVYKHNERSPRGKVIIITAGTSDRNVAEEARVCSEFFGNSTEVLYDVGVAGVHRLLRHYEVIKEANVVIVIAGMEGALPSVVGGLVGVPVIAVPTDVGYGASFNGIAALLGMLNSCAPNVTVVNINNGFGAAYVATLINQRSCDR